MKTLLKQKVNKDHMSGQSNGIRVTRQSTTVKQELTDSNFNTPKVGQGVKRAYSYTTQHQSNPGVVHQDDSFESSSASYSQPPAKKSGSLLYNTLSVGSMGDNHGRIKNRPGRKPTRPIENMNDDELRRLEDRRQKNKEAAQRCRSRRISRINELEERVKVLNSELTDLRTAYDTYSNVPDQLLYYLNPSTHKCFYATTPPTSSIQLATIMPAVHERIPAADSLPVAKKELHFHERNPPVMAAPQVQRPQYLNRPITDIIAQQKRPSSQPSPNVMLNFLPTGITPGLSEALATPNFLSTPGFPSSIGNNEFFVEVRTPSRDVAALDLQTPIAEPPRFTTL